MHWITLTDAQNGKPVDFNAAMITTIDPHASIQGTLVTMADGGKWIVTETPAQVRELSNEKGLFIFESRDGYLIPDRRLSGHPEAASDLPTDKRKDR
jgi:uncharacterized protein YlzI (FlbEa/FlbD family)